MSRLVTIAMILATLTGCDASIERFEPNEVFAVSLSRSRRVPTEAAVRDVSRVVDDLFGTPDEPAWPSELIVDPESRSLVDPQRLARAAGAFSSRRDGEHRGMYREHCVVCHGLSGSGAGPTSRLQSPYPRDFRFGVFKWKSTERVAKPTRDDLVRLLRRGIPGTAMPSFALLGSEDLDALVDYVIYLSVRGQVERELLAIAVDELGYEETAPAPSLRLQPTSAAINSGLSSDADEWIQEVVNEVVGQWHRADDQIADVAELPKFSIRSDDGPSDEYVASVDRGRELFHGQITGCAGCHGPAGNGQVVTLDYDDWTKDYTTLIGVTPSDRDAVQPLRDAGALPPRPISPRDLRAGVFHGGDDPATLYRRITQGIAGTPMPAVQVSETADGKGLTESQVWDLVRYIISLGERQQ